MTTNHDFADETADYRDIDFVADQLGEDAADRLCRLIGGARIYVPQGSFAPDSFVVRAIGAELAAGLAEAFAGDELIIPRQYRTHRQVRALVIDMRRHGATINEIAIAVGRTYRCVQIILQEARQKRLLPARSWRPRPADRAE